MADDTTYDFIVTGAGSAGCAVAGRRLDRNIPPNESDCRENPRSRVFFSRPFESALFFESQNQPAAEFLE
jgi:hypothetical protein